MALVRWTPRRAWDAGADMERVFDSVFPSFFTPSRREAGWPLVDVVETGDAIEVTAELPGVGENDIDLQIQDNVLSLRGQKQFSKEEKDEKHNVYYAERQYGSFERTLTLPAYVQADQAKATFKNGVLHIHLPKVEEKKARMIQISPEG